ncbi:ankyrin repeat protein [Acanthamoeba polyphaga moumouvirus]|uniref:Ankyrin repeat protein n=1 Tax=Acanthamoeba polyphaga moumouvirus TaxID=1269028 RepID=L7RCN5_9VIRU|nr:ankyrin repeat protein [Acanthamoeba polyphaga moumouvirus]AGC02374.1 ankyrin repeat protein [Acanthamoeba polyphaga moumouvirus]
MSSELYFKITNELECHNGYQYVDGLNILEEKFNDNPNDSCVSGRLYFCEPKDIIKYLDYGIYLRDVYLPINDLEFKMIKDPMGDKYGANRIIFGEKRDLRNPSTWDYMITKGVDIHYYHDHALKWASHKSYYQLVKYLVENGADIHSDNDLALRWASDKGHFEIVKYLVENGADVCADDNYSLIWSSYNGHFEIVKYLIENGANIHVNIDDPLRSASENGHLEIVKYLIESGANIHAQYDQALILACENEHCDVVKYLLDNGAVVNQHNNNLLQILHSRSQEESIIFIDCLIKNGINIDSLYGLFKCSCEIGYTQIVKYFIEKGIIIYNPEKVLISICVNGYFKTLQYLLKKIRINQSQKNKLLKKSLRNRHIKTLKILVENGADLHYSNDKLLRIACKIGNLEIVKYLIKNGADIKIGIPTPIEIASKHNHSKIVNFLVKSGANNK